MVGVVLLILVFGALIAAIWGRDTAQGCFRTVGNLFWIALAVGIFVAIPPLGFLVAFVYAFYLLIKFGRAYGKAAEEARMEKQWAEESKARPTRYGIPVSETKAETDASGPPSGALIAPQYCKPRPKAPTALPGAGADAEYWATPVRELGRSGYDVEERRSGCRVFLSVSEFGRDWVPCRAPLKPSPRSAEAPPTPRWSPPRQGSRRP